LLQEKELCDSKDHIGAMNSSGLVHGSLHRLADLSLKHHADENHAAP
jgi:hypothetical protein